MKAVHLTVTGYVQGVCFRYYTNKKANDLGLTGYVRNKGSNKVEVVAEGKEEPLKELVEFCKQGPSSAVVTDIKINYTEASNNYHKFKIE